MGDRVGWQFYAVGSAVFAALTAVLAKVGVAEVNADLATFIRTVVILCLTGLVVSVRGAWESPEKLSAKGVTFLVLSGVATGLSWLCYYRALQTGPASKVAPVDKLSVALVIVLAVLFLGEPVTGRLLLGGALVVAGVLILATG
jgi:transporter family protein